MGKRAPRKCILFRRIVIFNSDSCSASKSKREQQRRQSQPAEGEAAPLSQQGGALELSAGPAQPGDALARGESGDIPLMTHVIAQNVQPPAGNEYCALFVALIGETESPQGVVNTSEGRVVRAFHRFTLVDQTGRGQDVSKGRRRDQGAVKISCARQDPNARNCHGYRKFVKKSILEDPGRGLLVNDTIVIRYQIELVVSTGGALSKQTPVPKQSKAVFVPPQSLGTELLYLLEDKIGTDVCFDVDGELMEAHKIILQARSPVFRALLTGPMKEGHEGVVVIKDVKAPVFRTLLHFAYADTLPEDLQDSKLEVPMAQHLLAAADRFQLIRLRCICEQRLCDSVSVGTVATTLALAEQNNAKELKRVSLEFVSKNLQNVMASEGYEYLVQTCPQLQSELLAVIATTPPSNQRSRTMIGQIHNRGNDDANGDTQLRRIRARRE